MKLGPLFPLVTSQAVPRNPDGQWHWNDESPLETQTPPCKQGLGWHRSSSAIESISVLSRILGPVYMETIIPPSST